MATTALARNAAPPFAGDEGELLSAEQGQALVQYAMQSASRLRAKPDCSHLVHTIYSRAGLSYSYQPSRALYRGAATDFERVKKPQPGDLIVWRGHVGIVVSPRRKTFFSSVRSGIITESWTSHEWLVRGRPHFYRYRIRPDSNLELLASIAARTVEDGAIPDRMNSGNQEDVIEGQPRAASASNDADIEGGNAETSSSDDPQDRVGQAEGAQAESAREDGQAESGTGVAAPEEHVTVFTPTLATIRQRGKPKKKQIEAAFLEAAKANAQQVLEPEAPAGIAQLQPLTVFTRAEVGRIRIKGERGSVKIKLTENMSFEQGRVLPGKTIERELSIVRRNQDGSTVWVITDPAQRTYLPAAQALTVFAHEAEIMLRRAPNTPATRAVVKALDLLYDQQPAHPESAELQ
ncbi:MAG TPA: NlpC/P60 family protein [Candidatus Angelobacter sp.]|nr:NlpC/P60 family protein [Candidatus Angelobacter sp.]